MILRYKKPLNVVFLFTFLFISLFINFFHTEKNVLPDHFCPACHFQKSTLATNQINFFHIPQLNILEILKTFHSFNYTYIFSIESTSRSPPQI